MNNKPQFVVVHGGTVYAPELLGKKDLLIAGGRIVHIDESISLPKSIQIERIDATRKIIIPGLIDLHVHVLGGGGEDGPVSRVPEIALGDLVSAGTTTVVGVLGTDAISRSPEALLTKIMGLRTQGVSAYMYTGSYHLPSVTITGSVDRDLALIDQVVGVKIAISDHRGSQPTTEELARLASQVRVGAMLGGKMGIVHLHVGGGRNGITKIFDVIESTELPLDLFLPTHMARTPALLDQGIEFVRRGGNIDLTAHPEERETVAAMEKLIREDVDLAHVTLSSDGNGSMPVFDERKNLVGMETGSVATLFHSVRAIISGNVMPLSEALTLVTTNPASRLGLDGKKGRITEGADADLVILDDHLVLDKVLGNGHLMVNRGQAIVRGRFEAQ
ncbi:MAG TPA: beta-aspartyl-peptidase [Candidatus Acetothermia bacterium]|nr:beta-aspartyl-peptidase [Candidatus Acetothermia bacterium]